MLDGNEDACGPYLVNNRSLFYGRWMSPQLYLYGSIVASTYVREIIDALWMPSGNA